jgi:hypothetical protein
MTQEDQDEIAGTLAACEQAIVAMVRPLLLYRLVLETQIAMGRAGTTAQPILRLVEYALECARECIGDSVIDADMTTVQAMRYDEPTLQGIISAA